MKKDDPSIRVPEPTSAMMLTERERLFTLSPKDALDAIVDSPHAAALVQSLPGEDLHLLIHEIGLEDSLPLLAMAEDHQWTYLLDIETWEQDRMDRISFGHWLNHLMKADPDRLVGRFLETHLEDIELYLTENIRVKIRENDQDPTEFGDEYVTLDDRFYIRFLDDPTDSDAEPSGTNERKDALTRFLQQLAAHDHFRYQQVLLEAASVIASETEEEMYRLRNVRLAEKGFLPFHEAVGIYQPLGREDLQSQGVKVGMGASSQDIPTSVPFPPAKATEAGRIFTDAVGLIEAEDTLMQLQAEIAGLSNQIVTADKLKIRERVQLDHVVRKAMGYIGLGLEEMLSDAGGIDLRLAVELIERFPLSHIFRIGYGSALKLKWRAERWQPHSYATAHGLPLSFWGEQWLGVLGGLLIDRPLFYDPYGTGELYREFATRDDIRNTEGVLDEIVAFDDLLSRMTVPSPYGNARRQISHDSLVLTLWARHYLGLPAVPEPITLDVLRDLFKKLWSVGDPQPRISPAVKASFLEWFSSATGQTQQEITSVIGGVLDRLFEELEHEYGKVSTDRPDPRYIRHFLLER